MAYGKIKADAIIYDNSGSDVEKTLVSLVTPDEGTAIKSTGESGTTKFLRVDGDGTCSWQVPPDTNTQLGAEAIQDVVGAMVTGNTETGIAVTYEDGDGTLDFVVGTLNQDTTGTAAIATTVTVADESSDTTCFPLFVTGATGNLAPKSGTNITFNSSTGLLSATAVTTTGDVVVGGDLTVSGSTTTVNTATLEVEDKNIELGKVSSPSDSTANGGGITLKGASDIEWKWVSSTGAWTSTEGIHLPDGEMLRFGADSDLRIYHSSNESKIINQTGSIWLQSDTGIRFTDHGLNESMAAFYDNGACELYYDGTKKIETTAAGVTVSGTVTDSKGDVRKIPQNEKNSAYTLIAADAGKHISTNSAVTIPPNVFAVGDAVTIYNYNGSSDIALTRGSNVYLFNAADGTNADRTLSTRGLTTLLCVASNQFVISGAGLS